MSEFKTEVSKALDLIHEVDHNLMSPVPSAAKPIQTPIGILRKDFTDIVEAAVLHHQLTAGMSPLSVDIVKTYCPRLAKRLIEKALGTKEFRSMMVLRGVIRESDGLSGEQMRALSVLTDVTSNLKLVDKLKRAGVPWYKWQAWMNDPLFRAHHDKLAGDLFSKMQSAVDEAVVSGALDNKLEFIKYYNEISGKHDPARRAHQDVQQILDSIVDIITRNVKDPVVLQQISAELSAALSVMK